MTSKSSRNALPMNDYKAVLAEASILKKPYLGIGHLCKENRILPRPVWFKGSRYRDFRGNLAA